MNLYQTHLAVLFEWDLIHLKTTLKPFSLSDYVGFRVTENKKDFFLILKQRRRLSSPLKNKVAKCAYVCPNNCVCKTIPI